MDINEFNSGRPLLRPVRQGNAFEETIERLLQGIRLGVFPAGSRLPPERELAESLGISRATLRDALAELQKAGFVVVQRGRYGGTSVAERVPRGAGEGEGPESGEIRDVLIFRRVVEPEAAALAAQATLTASERAHLLATLEEVTAADREGFRPRDARFHIAIAELSGSPSLTAAVLDARSRISALLDFIPMIETNLEHSNRQHRGIVDAILSGDSEAARRACADHLAGTEALLRGFLGDSPRA
ncbi:FadR/GntR family transcriptional regulator [Mycetocola spongiae]|uniref:FadR/GntR family transcriptional regulator n=1 Tax=Mycetocola spongiae TaxID=2859226 RepID=UPI001CF255FD|nr:FCD domain-containing protein [Mycetocola spongiae]UCR90084.1 FCD domain-containing protein [Mycetocola spongiae]